MKISTEEANKKWIESLGKFRTYVSENNEGSRNMLCFYTNLSETWGRFLFEKNVIYGDENGFYRWNEKIPITMSLITSYRNWNKEIRIIKKHKTPKEMKSIQKPPAPNRRRRTPSIVVEQTPQSQVGLIRKFLRWLY